MTELEKVKQGNYEAVDLNKLADELRKEHHSYLANAVKEANKGKEAFFNTDLKDHLKPAMNIQLAVLALLMKVCVPEKLIPHYAAGIGSLRSILLNMSDNPKANNSMAMVFETILDEHTTTVHMKIPRKLFEEDSQP